MARAQTVEGRPLVIEIDGDLFLIRRVRPVEHDEIVDGHGEPVREENGKPKVVLEAEITGVAIDSDVDLDDEDAMAGAENHGDEREYRLFASIEDAGFIARSNLYENILGGIHSGGKTAKAAYENAVEMLGKENLVRWALGLPAGPGSRQTTSLPKWFDLCLEEPFEELSFYDNESHDVSAAKEPDYLEAMNELSMQRLERMIGFHPEYAARTN